MQQSTVINSSLNILVDKYGFHKGACEQENPFKVLVATIISQRTLDETTERVSKKLFKKFPTPDKLAKATTAELEKILYGAGFYRQKAKSLKSLAKTLVGKFNSKVPSSLNDLLSLSKVGRKTANCVLVYGYGILAIAVDTHVHRIVHRLGWVKTKTGDETEKALVKIVPKKYWLALNRIMVAFGKDLCRPVNPKCPICPLLPYCPFGQKRVKYHG